MRHLHTGGSCSVVSGQGCVIMTSFGPALGGLPSLRKLCPIFRFVILSRKNQLFCAPILYRYIIIKLYNNTTIFSRLLPICVCFRGSAPDPARGLTASPDPSWERLCFGKSVTYFFFFPNDMPELNYTVKSGIAAQFTSVYLHNKSEI